MFKDQRLHDRVDYLEATLKEEYEARWALELTVQRLMTFLRLYEVQQPNLILKQKDK